MDFVYIVIDAFVHRLDTVLNKYLPLQLPRLMYACEAFYLLINSFDFLCVINFDDCTASTRSFSSGSSKERFAM